MAYEVEKSGCARRWAAHARWCRRRYIAGRPSTRYDKCVYYECHDWIREETMVAEQARVRYN